MNKSQRMHNTAKHINKRKKVMKDFGLQAGCIYDRHREKISKSLGYVRDGNLSHYASVGFHRKTRDRNRYGKVKYLCIRDQKAYNNQESQIEELGLQIRTEE